MELPSKELLSEILDKPNLGEPFSQNINNLIGVMDGEIWITINIHELAHKCKEWLYGIGFTTEYVYAGENSTCVINDFKSEVCEQPDIFQADTEPEAIFKATQWVMKQKGGKNGIVK